MALNNKIGFGNIWLTDDGTDAGFACQVDLAGLPFLKMKWWGAASRNARGNAEMNLSPVAGVDLTMTMPSLLISVMDSIIELFNDSLDEDEPFRLQITGETGDFDLSADPNPDSSVAWADTLNGYALDVTIRVITRAAEED